MKVPKPRKLPSGSWFIQLRLGRESIPITASTEKECIRQAQYVKSEYLAGKRAPKVVPEVQQLPTLTKTIDNFILKRGNGLSPSTVCGYRAIQRTRFKTLMSRSLSDITEPEWLTAVNDEVKLCSPKTLKNAWAFVREVCLAEYKMVLPDATLPQVPPNPRAFLDADQIKVFIAATDASKYQVEVLLALSGLRCSEICGLHWENVDLPHRKILVKGAMVRNEKHKLVEKASNKNATSTRYVPIMMDELYQALSRREPKTGLVCTCHPCTILREINRLCAGANLPKVSTHGLRHSFASLAYHLHVPEKITMEIGGWSDDRTMKKIYTHIAQSDMERYEKEFSSFFNPGQPEDGSAPATS